MKLICILNLLSSLIQTQESQHFGVLSDALWCPLEGGLNSWGTKKSPKSNWRGVGN